jgi:hypothetical protein
MSHQTVNMAVPSSGDGAASDISFLAPLKTIVLGGNFTGIYTILGSNDGSSYVPVAQFDAGGLASPVLIVDMSLQSMRVRSTAAPDGPVTITVTGDLSFDNNFAALPAPHGATGPQSPIDLYSLFPPSGLVAGLNVICRGVVNGSVIVEARESGSTFVPVGQFTGAGESELEFAPLKIPFHARYLRINIVGSASVDVSVGGVSENDSDLSPCDVYSISEHFDSIPTGSLRWATDGIVRATEFQGGTWEMRVAPDPNGVQQSFTIHRLRTLTLANNDGTIPDPPLSFQTRAFITPSATPDGTINYVGLLDLPDNVYFAFTTLGGLGMWSVLMSDGVNPPQVIPTGIASATSLATAQSLELLETVEGRVLVKIDEVVVGLFDIPAPLKAHLYSLVALVQRQNPADGGSLFIDSFCASEGFSDLTEHTEPVFGQIGDFIQSRSNYASGDFSTSDTVNWQEIMNVLIETQSPGDYLLVTAAIASENDTPGEQNLFRVTIDGTPIPSAVGSASFSAAGAPQTAAIMAARYSPNDASAHVLRLEWLVTGGVGKILAQSKPTSEIATLNVSEVAV